MSCACLDEASNWVRLMQHNHSCALFPLAVHVCFSACMPYTHTELLCGWRQVPQDFAAAMDCWP
jgi:hypothetical protein